MDHCTRMIYANSSPANFKDCEQCFREKWHFPNCLGCVDGKHFQVKNPPHAGSIFHNCKQHFSIVLQSLVDANCKFIAIDVGAYGRQSNGGVFRDSKFGACLHIGMLYIPGPKPLSNSNIILPYIILDDEAYPLSKFLMHPFQRQDLSLVHTCEVRAEASEASMCS